MDSFEEFYSMAMGQEKVLKEDGIMQDANSIKDSIDVFVRAINDRIDETIKAEELKGTRTDLIFTLISGGLAFTASNVYHMLKRRGATKMERDQFLTTFIGMVDTALRDLEKGDDK